MKRNVLILMLLLLGNTAFSQLTTFDNPNQTNCIGQAYYQDSLLNPTAVWADNNYNILQTGGSVLNNLCAGDYFLILTDTLNNTDTLAFTINYVFNCNTFNTYLSVSTYPSPGNCNGILNSSVSGGVSPYNYSWSDGQSTQNAINLCSNTYNLTVTDSNGCVASATQVLTDSIVIDIVTTNNSNCNGTANIFSDTSSLTSWYWTNTTGTTLMTGGDYLTGLCFGTYYFIYTDINNQIDTVEFVINDNGLCDDIHIVGVYKHHPYSGNSNGLIIVSLTGGSLPYQFSWPNNPTSPPLTQYNYSQISNLNSGYYLCEAIDNNGCLLDTTVYLADSIWINTTFGTDSISCDGVASISDSTSLTTWTWLDSTGNVIQINGNQIGNLCNGNYSIITTDINNFVDTLTFTIEDVATTCLLFYTVASNIGQPTFNNCDGHIYLSHSNGLYPYNYNWNDINLSGNSNYQMCQGSYTVITTDANGCQDTISITLVEQSINYSVTTTINSDQSNCNGTASINDSTNLTSWYWTNDLTGNIIQIGGYTIDSLCSGTYSLWTTDVNNNLDTVQFDISYYDICNGFLISTLELSNPQNSCLGSATVNVTGGTAPYSYLWSNGETAMTINNLCPDIYYLTVIDANNCVVTDNIILIDSTNMASLSINAVTLNSSSNTNCDGSATLTITGGVSPYIVSGDTIYNGTLQLDSLCPGIYSTTATDSNGDVVTIGYIIATDSTTIISNPFTSSGSVSIDTTANGIVENCIINYQLIDSANVTGVNIIAADSVIVNYTIYYNNGSTEVITEVYQFNFGAGVYTVILDLFCPNKSTFNFLKVIDEINFDPSMIGTSWYLNLENKTELEINIYPNPFNSDITIQLTKEDNYNITLFDISGKLVLSSRFENTNEIKLDALDLSKGQYILRIQNDDTIITRKIVK